MYDLATALSGSAHKVVCADAIRTGCGHFCRLSWGSGVLAAGLRRDMIATSQYP